MKKLIIATTIALAITTATSQSAYATDNSDLTEQKNTENTNELIGFGSGATAGALVGGPVGAIIGGIFGVLIADDINGDKQLENAHIDLAKAKQNINKQEQTIVAMQDNLQNMQEQQMIQLASFDEQTNDAWLDELYDFETNLQFKTASFLVEDIYQEQLNSIASLLTNYPQLSVQLTGYADQRGDSQYNKSLSEQRAKAVKGYLLKKNVSPAQISVQGMGEVTLAKQIQTNSNDNIAANTKPQISIEDLFFARKVNVNLIKTNQQMTAAN